MNDHSAAATASISSPPRLSGSTFPPTDAWDAVIVGSGPNGLAAAIVLARSGWKVLVLEAKATLGGGMRTKELTLPGFRHDVCSAIHPLGVASPFFRDLPLAKFGLSWCFPEVSVAQPFGDAGQGLALIRDLEAMADALGRDGASYRRIFAPLVDRADELLGDVLAPLRFPQAPVLLTRFGLSAIQSAQGFAQRHFRETPARALFAGNAAHSVLPLERPLSAAFGIMLLVTAHAYGWPVARGGSQAIADALVGYGASLGVTFRTGCNVRTLADLPPSRVALFDTSPKELSGIAGEQLPARFRAALNRYRHGPAAYKVDWALREPIPWKNPACRQAGTVHVGGTLEEVADSERACWQGCDASHPFVLLGQQSIADSSRAPTGQHTGWAYCHVPSRSEESAVERIEAQIERFAPGFRDCILARSVLTPRDLENYNANYVGGDIIGGVQDWRQAFARPTLRLNPYTTPNPRLFLCSASTPPGGGVHGMCGYHAAQTVLGRAGRVPVSRW